MKVFVTGGTGHIGAWLVKSLAEKGYEVVVGVRDISKASFLIQPGVTLFLADVSNKSALMEGMKECHTVFHLAALAAVWAKNPADFEKINVEGTRNVLEAANANQVKRVVVTSSAGNLGPDHGTMVNEKTIRKIPFLNPYEKTKSKADEIARDWFAKGMDVIIVYPTRVFGPVLNGPVAAMNLVVDRIVNKGFRMVPGKGSSIGNYVYIDDVIEGFLLVLEKGKAGESYILGGENMGLNGFYAMVMKSTGHVKRLLHIPLFILRVVVAGFELLSKLGIPPVLTRDWLKKIEMDYRVSSDKAVQELGYKITPVQEALEKTVSWMQSKN